MTPTAKGRRKGRFGPLLAAATVFAMAFAPVAADAQGRARGSRADPGLDRPAPNQTRPLPEIVAQVQATPPYSGMDYIGLSGFEARTMVYVLRFLDGRQVVIVHVDARSGRILGRTP